MVRSLISCTPIPSSRRLLQLAPASMETGGMTQPFGPDTGGPARSIRPLVFVGVAAVLAVDAGGSLISTWTGLRYSYFAVVSFAIYAAIGIIARRRAGSIRSSALAGLGVALFDTTVGWWISWFIGPGRVPTAASSPHLVILTVVLVVAFDTVVAVAAGAVWNVLSARRSWRM